MRTTIVLTAALVLVPACDFLKPKISQDKLESALTSWLEGHDLEAKEIHCPDDQPAEKGHTFECTCQVHGAEIPVSVQVLDESGTVQWEPKYLTLKKDSVEVEIAKSELLKGHDVKIDCHDPVWVSIPDSEWKCEVTDNSDSKQYVATVKFNDGKGNHDLNLDPE